MTWLTSHRATTAGVWLATAVLAGGSSGSVLAGDAIVFGTDKNRTPKVEPGKEKAPVQNPFRLESLTTPAPFIFDGMTPPVLPRASTNPRKDKRQQNAEDEKKNWMMLEKGELNDKDEEKNFLGVRDDSDELDKGKDGHDYTFKDRDSSHTPGQLRAPGQSPARPPSQRRESEARDAARQNLDSETRRSSAILFGSGEKSVGSHTGHETDLKNLNSRAGERSLGKPDFSLRDLITAGEGQRGRDEQVRSESFKQLLGSSPSSPGSDPINFPSDFTRQPLNPVLPAALGDSAPKSFGADSYNFRPAVSQPNNPVNFLGSQDVNSRPSAYGQPVQPSGPYRATEVPWPKRNF